jgi:hypothetical protein
MRSLMQAVASDSCLAFRNLVSAFTAHAFCSIRHSDWLGSGRPRSREFEYRRGKNFFFSTSSRPLSEAHPVSSAMGTVSWFSGDEATGA